MSSGETDGSREEQKAALQVTKETLRETRLVEWLQFCVNFVLVVIGVVAIYIYGGQLKVMRGQLGEVERQYPELQKSANAARDAANAAQTAVTHQAKQFIVDERPYVTAEYIRIAGKPTIGQKLMGEVLWKNAGKTPALNGHVYTRIDILPKEPCCSREWEREAWSSLSTIDIGSGLARATSVTGDAPLNEEWNKKLTAGRLYMFGAFVYADVFGRRHASDFCGFYKPESVQDRELNLWACYTKHNNDVK